MPRRQTMQTKPGETNADWPLTASQVRELNRRLDDLKDRRRYLLASAFTPRFVLYYDVSRDVWAANDPAAGTLFKRRDAAAAIGGLLRAGVQIVRCRVDARERLIKASVPRLGRGRAKAFKRRTRRHRSNDA